MDSGSMPYAQVHFPFAGFEDPSVRRIESIEEKETCLNFFEKMWKEEFDMDFRNRPHTTYEAIKEDFMQSQVYIINE